MTIIKKTTTVSRYPYTYLSQELVNDLISSYSVAKGNEKSKNWKNWKNHVFKLLECYCHLHNQRIQKCDLNKDSVQTLISDFFRVLKGNSLIPTDSTHKSYRYEEIKGALTNVLQREHKSSARWLQESNWRSINGRSLNLDEFDETTLLYWSGWPISSRKDKPAYLDITSLYHSHGRAFTLQYYSGWRNFFKKQACANTPHTNRFANFLAKKSEQWPSSTFQNPVTLTHCFKDYLKQHFLEVLEECMTLIA